VWGETIKIELKEKYHATYVGQLKLEEEVNRPPSIQLQPGSGQLLVALSRYEEGTQVFIDNQLAGSAPLKAKVIAGMRSVSVQLGKKLGKIHAAEVENGKLTRIVIDATAGNSCGGSWRGKPRVWCCLIPCQAGFRCGLTAIPWVKPPIRACRTKWARSWRSPWMIRIFLPWATEVVLKEEFHPAAICQIATG
jgi:hypothetical protein